MCLIASEAELAKVVSRIHHLNSGYQNCFHRTGATSKFIIRKHIASLIAAPWELL